MIEQKKNKRVLFTESAYNSQAKQVDLVMNFFLFEIFCENDPPYAI